MGRKIAVVGASPAGFTQLAYLANKRYEFYNEYKDDEYVLIHDPDKVLPVMLSGTNPAYWDELAIATNMNRRWLSKYADGVDSHGYKFIGFGKRRDKNFMASYRSQTGSHFDIEKFRTAMLEDGGKAFGDNVSIIEEKIDSYQDNPSGGNINGVQYDYVIDCSETEPLKDEDAFGNPSISAVNTCLVLEKPEAGHWDYTIEYAAKYGHITGIPLKSKQLWIYFYNSLQTEKDDILNDMQSAFPDDDISKWKQIGDVDGHSFRWTPRFSNYCVCPTTGRYIRNGAMLINVEPFLATTYECVHVMCDAISSLIHTLVPREIEHIKQQIQDSYFDLIAYDYQTYLAFIYHLGSRHDTDFWRQAKDEALNILNDKRLLHPGYFPGKKWIDGILCDKWDDEQYRRLIQSDNEIEDIGGRNKVMPLCIMNDYTTFAEIATGLGASYSDRFRVLDMCDPPEDYGTIGYEYC